MITIHGKQYVTVAERVEIAHKDNDMVSITTELLPITSSVVVKATVITKKGTFTGISAANPTKPIEKLTPYEVAETSAVGRALGFAGYGIVEGIATADEVTKAQDEDPSWITEENADDHTCPKHATPMKFRGKGIYDHRMKGKLTGENLLANPDGDWYTCTGSGWKLSMFEAK